MSTTISNSLVETTMLPAGNVRNALLVVVCLTTIGVCGTVILRTILVSTQTVMPQIHGSSRDWEPEHDAGPIATPEESVEPAGTAMPVAVPTSTGPTSSVPTPVASPTAPIGTPSPTAPAPTGSVPAKPE